MTTDEFPVTLRSSKGAALAGAIFMGFMMLAMLWALVAGIQRWPQSPALPLSAISLFGTLLLGWLTYLSVNQWRRPYTVVIDKSGLSLTIRGKTRIIPWQDVSRVAQTGHGLAVNTIVVLLLKPNSPTWLQNKTFPREQLTLPRFWDGQSLLNSNDFKALLERARATS